MKITKEKFKALRDGDHTVFDEIFCSYYGKVKGFINKTIRSEDDAEELAQDVFMKLWENRQSLNSEDTLFAYIFKLAKHSACRYISKKCSERAYIDNELHVRDDSDNGTENKINAEELDLLITMIVSKMPEQRKRIFEMSRNEGLSNSEIADILRISKRTVESHLYQAMKDVQKILYFVVVAIFVL